ncbi:hypothetical protein [Paenibacillus humicus]|uniref:hypothetical protein n=1 Tax=Paenibacillus humicus TaxID=412861 RepID=UPI003D2ACCCE
MSNHIDPKVQEIIDRHAAATPGPWQAEGKEIWRRGEGYSGENRHVYITDVQNWENRTFIANAWADEAYLLSQVERLQEENHAMKEALKWYGDKKTYETNLNDQWEPVTLIDQDLGEKAREALSHLKGE